jgi:oxalate decarboxylase/phosphoglucose isomerase-like protein (cupin superfamily)
VALQYHIEGEARMGVFGASGQARTFDFRSGDVGYVPFAMGHYIDNMGTTSLRYLEIFKSSYYAEPTHGLRSAVRHRTCSLRSGRWQSMAI